MLHNDVLTNHRAHQSKSKRIVCKQQNPTDANSQCASAFSELARSNGCYYGVLCSPTFSKKTWQPLKAACADVPLSRATCHLEVECSQLAALKLVTRNMWRGLACSEKRVPVDTLPTAHSRFDKALTWSRAHHTGLHRAQPRASTCTLLCVIQLHVLCFTMPPS